MVYVLTGNVIDSFSLDQKIRLYQKKRKILNRNAKRSTNYRDIFGLVFIGLLEWEGFSVEIYNSITCYYCIVLISAFASKHN